MQIQSQSEWNRPRFQNAQPGLGFSPVVGSYVAGSRPFSPEPQMSGSDVKQTKPAEKPRDEFHEEKRQGHGGNASTWMSMYKFCGPLVAGIGYGAILGTPIAFAAGVSFIVSSLQVAVAQKIHKEDTPWAKNVVHHTRKLMGREKDHSAAGKEWSMVPVWGVVCAMAGLLEASINHLFAHKFPAQSIKELKGKIKKANSYLRPIYHMQAKGMKFAADTRKYLLALSNKIPVTDLRKIIIKQIKSFGEKSHGRAKWAYIAGMGVAGCGGMLQSASLAKFQQSIDTRHTKKSQEHEAEKAERGKNDVGTNSKSQEKPDVKTDKPSAASENKVDRQRNEEAPIPANPKPEKQSPEKAVENSQTRKPALNADEQRSAKAKSGLEDKAGPQQEKEFVQQPIDAINSTPGENKTAPAVKPSAPLPAEKMPEKTSLPAQPMPTNAWVSQPVLPQSQPFMPWQTWGMPVSAMTVPPMVPPVS